MKAQKGILDYDDYLANRKKKPELKFRLSARAAIVADTIAKYSANKKNLKILDFGTAEGRTLIELNRFLPGNELIGIDYSQEVINLAPALPENITLVHGDVTKLPNRFTSASFDIVCALGMLEYLEAPLNAVQEAYRVLKPEGLFIATCSVAVWNRISTKLGLLKGGGDHYISKRLMVKIVKDAGFDLLQYRKFMWAPISFLPYLHIPISSMFSIKCDKWIETVKILNWLFVNQVVIGRKSS